MFRFYVTVFFGLAILLSSASFGAAKCTVGKADEYPCLNVDFVSSIDLRYSGLVTPPASLPVNGLADYGSGAWGWTDPIHHREYALMGLTNKLAIVDITTAEKPVHIADVPTQTVASLWREVSVLDHYAVIVSEAMGHGLQIVDLNRLDSLPRDIVTVLKPDTVYNLFGSSHTVFAHTATGYVYAMGSDTCDAGVHVVDMRVPLKPKFSTCLDRQVFEPQVFAMDGAASNTHMDAVYTHDMMCVIYHGPTIKYKDHEICVASNDSTLNIVDVTDKTKPKLLAVTSHPEHGFIHQGWFTEDQKYFAVNDELDEMIYNKNMTTHFYDFSDLENPQYMMTFDHGVKSIDHNHFVKGRYLYQANYLEGLTILDLEKVSEGKITIAGKFDTTPTRSGIEFGGIWNVYPYFPSGNVILSSINDGTLYIVHPNLPQ